MNEALKTLEDHSIAALELLTILENGDVDVSEKLSRVYAFTELTAVTITSLGGTDDAQSQIQEFEDCLAEAQARADERNEAFETQAARASKAEQKVAALEKELTDLNQEHAKQIARLEKTNSDLEKELERAGHEVGITDDVPTGVVTAHKRLAEGLKKYGDGDYEAALKKLIVAEKTLKKIDGRTFDYD